MIVNGCQRSTSRRVSFVPPRGAIRTSEYEVAEDTAPAIAKAFVAEHHYEGTASPTAHTFTLHRHGALVGTALFGPLASTNAHRAVFPTLAHDKGVTLGRLVLLEEVLGNGESWFIARCFERLRAKGIVGVESCSDPWPRTDECGDRVFVGHIGVIYQATNGRYVGVTQPSSRRLLPDGRLFNNRASGKIARAEVGRRYAVDQLVRFGAEPLRADEDPLAWIRRWRPLLTRAFRHQGNHRYMWCLDRRRRREVLAAPAIAYPKIEVST